MSTDFFTGDDRRPETNYVPPQWPALDHLYLGSATNSGGPYVLWYRSTMLRFTLYWTIIFFTIAYLITGFIGFIVLWRDNNKRLGLVLLIGYTVFGTGMGAISGAIVGQLLGNLYAAGYMAMSTWIPLVWALIQILTTITYADNDVRLRTL